MERKGVEPSTSALRTQEACDASDGLQEVTATPTAACTTACTNEAGSANGKGQATTADSESDPALAALAGLLRGLDPTARAALAAMLMRSDG